jgi:LacI family gluconate utilization system Gnt-I transcriptional repressor
MMPPLTTVRTPRSEIGARAAQILISLMRGEEVPPHSLNLGFELVARESA